MHNRRSEAITHTFVGSSGTPTTRQLGNRHVDADSPLSCADRGVRIAGHSYQATRGGARAHIRKKSQLKALFSARKKASSWGNAGYRQIRRCLPARIPVTANPLAGCHET